MSHELRTPLNSIIGFSRILARGGSGPVNEVQEKQLETVHKNALHLLSLINDLLDITKIEADETVLVYSEFAVHEVVESVVESAATMAEKKGLWLRTSFTPEIDTLVSDRRRFRQVLTKLVSNAVKFTREGGVQVNCAIEDGRLVTHVTDTGIGIKEKDHAKLFQPFRQIDSGLARQHDGTGLGLAISLRIVKMLGGDLSAESEWGSGSTFTMVVPLVGEDLPRGSVRSEADATLERPERTPTAAP